MKKVYKILKSKGDRETVWEGTIGYLVGEVFGYLLECGHSWNSKIPEKPKTGKSLVKALNDSAYECHRYDEVYELL